MAAEYYTVESLRSQLLQIGQTDSDFYVKAFPDNWEYCPCVLVELKHCVNDRCIIKIGIFFNDPNIGRFPIEIIFIKQKQSGFIPTSHPRLKKLVENNVIDRKALVTVSF